MTPARITVLYEDQGAPGSAGVLNFGPHNLLVSCVRDDLLTEGRVVLDLYTARKEKLVAVPKNGNAKVRAECAAIRLTTARDGSPVVALYDFDRIHELVRDEAIRRRRCRREMREELRGASDAPDLLRVYFLDRNTESLVESACMARGVPYTGKPRPLERDGCLNGLALSDDDAARAMRSQVRSRVPSFEYVVRKVGELAAPLLVLSS